MLRRRSPLALTNPRCTDGSLSRLLLRVPGQVHTALFNTARAVPSSKNFGGKSIEPTRRNTPTNLLQRPTCGASFCGVGRLVYFSNIPRAGGSRDLHDSSTATTKRADEGGSLARFFRTKKSLQRGAAARAANTTDGTANLPSRLPTAVSIFELSGLVELARPVGVGAVVQRDPVEQCRLNMVAAEAAGRPDLARTWKLAHVVFLASCGPSGGSRHIHAPWSRHPCGGNTIEKLADFYFRKKDVQMVAALAALAVTATTGSAEPTAASTGLLSVAAARRFAPAQLMYSDVLYRWGHITASAAMRNIGLASLGHQSLGRDAGRVRPIDVTTFQLRCKECNASRYGPVCSSKHCKKRTNVCAVCRELVRERTVFCLECCHGGHERCMRAWLATAPVCPTGCGCRCSEV
jgi:hypothetical protein